MSNVESPCAPFSRSMAQWPLIRSHGSVQTARRDWSWRGGCWARAVVCKKSLLRWRVETQTAESDGLQVVRKSRFFIWFYNPQRNPGRFMVLYKATITINAQAPIGLCSYPRVVHQDGSTFLGVHLSALEHDRHCDDGNRIFISVIIQKSLVRLRICVLLPMHRKR